MKLAIMQPYVFPYLGYIQLLNLVDTFVFYDDVNFIKKGWIHRNQILLNGQAHRFSIPLVKPSQNRLICETAIADYSKWKELFLTQLKHAYSKASNYNQGMAVVEAGLDVQPESISDLAISTNLAVAHHLDIDTKILKSSELHGGHDNKASARIIDICKHLQASHYINPTNGRQLYNREDFKANNLELSFIKMLEFSYPQQGANEYVPYLSIIDLLMNLDKLEIQQLTAKFELE